MLGVAHRDEPGVHHDALEDKRKLFERLRVFLSGNRADLTCAASVVLLASWHWAVAQPLIKSHPRQHRF